MRSHFDSPKWCFKTAIIYLVWMKVRSLGSITSCGTFWMFQSKIPIEVHAVGSLQSPLLLGQPGEWRLREHLHATKEISWKVNLCYLLKSVQSAHSYLSTKRCFSSHIIDFIRLLKTKVLWPKNSPRTKDHHHSPKTAWKPQNHLKWKRIITPPWNLT